MGRNFNFNDSLPQFISDATSCTQENSFKSTTQKMVYVKPYMESFEPTVWGATNIGCGLINVGCIDVGCINVICF